MASLDFFGIDYGSKIAGTTVIAYLESDRLQIVQSAKKQDADRWILDHCDNLKPEMVFLDAPLSLPAAYFGKGEDYFYRLCDRECKAMSPMFLGGLTARAMALDKGYNKAEFIECYPGMLARQVLKLGELYNKKSKLSDQAVEQLLSLLPYELDAMLDNWHQFDALLCWLTGYRYQKGEALKIGDKEEGLIIV